MALKYLGQAFILGVPARDLSDEEVEQLGEGAEAFLIGSGLYEKVEEVPPANKMKSKYEVKDGHQSVS